ncbi:MAG: RpiB/LacA/LacB family sugar-phosphate isomerase [Christensenellales bacterium]|jgi:ribose 5-phosphate isomerase B
MNVAIACDFAGFSLKQHVLTHVQSLGHTVIDLGQNTEDKDIQVTYPKAASAAARTLQNGQALKAIVICGSGAGVSIVCNKFKGVYCVACESVYTANLIPFINNANALAMGANVVGKGQALEMVDAFLNNSFLKGATEERANFLRALYEEACEVESAQLK